MHGKPSSRALLLVLFFVCFFTLGSSRTLNESEIQLQNTALKKKVALLKSKYVALNQQIKNWPGERLFDVASLCEARLTTESGAGISTSDRTAQSTIYLTPYYGNAVSLYDGSTWESFTFAEVSLALSGLTSDKNYDVFLYSNAGTLTLELSSAWTNDTTRADAIVAQNGVYVKSGATTRRFIGTIRTTSTTTTEDSKSKRFVWNYLNRHTRMLLVTDSTNSWSYASTSWRAANNAAANKVEYVVGLNDIVVSAHAYALVQSSSGALNYASTGVGVDSTTVNSASLRGSGTDDTTKVQVLGDYSGYTGLGYHYLQWLEASHATGITFFGDNGDATIWQTGMSAEIQN